MCDGRPSRRCESLTGRGLLHLVLGVGGLGRRALHRLRLNVLAVVVLRLPFVTHNGVVERLLELVERLLELGERVDGLLIR